MSPVVMKDSTPSRYLYTYLPTYLPSAVHRHTGKNPKTDTGATPSSDAGRTVASRHRVFAQFGYPGRATRSAPPQLYSVERSLRVVRVRGTVRFGASGFGSVQRSCSIRHFPRTGCNCRLARNPKPDRSAGNNEGSSHDQSIMVRHQERLP